MRHELPNWIEQPVPEFKMNPIHDAVGKFVNSCVELEIWLATACSKLTPGMSYDKAERLDTAEQIRRLQGTLADSLPPEDAVQLRSVMDTCREIVELRNGIIHGIWVPSADGTLREAQRQDRRSPTGPALKNRFTREHLIGASLAARSICGFIQTAKWPETSSD